MSLTIEDSKKFDIVCMSFGKEKGKEIEVVEADKKDSFIIESMEIKVGNCNAKDILAADQISQLRENRKERKTAKALARLASQR